MPEEYNYNHFGCWNKHYQLHQVVQGYNYQKEKSNYANLSYRLATVGTVPHASLPMEWKIYKSVNQS